MASSSGNSSSSAATPTGSEGDARNSSGALIDQRKRRRMESNRESARRSRQRKQKHLDDLTGQILHLTKENGQILSGIDSATQHLVAVEAENSILRAQVAELSQRLQSLDEILNFICSINFNGGRVAGVDDGSSNVGGFGFDGHGHAYAHAQQHPIMAAGAGDLFGT